MRAVTWAVPWAVLGRGSSTREASDMQFGGDGPPLVNVEDPMLESLLLLLLLPSLLLLSLLLLSLLLLLLPLAPPLLEFMTVVLVIVAVADGSP